MLAQVSCADADKAEHVEQGLHLWALLCQRAAPLQAQTAPGPLPEPP